MYGPVLSGKNESFLKYEEESGLKFYMTQATHLVWATGGNMVPAEEAQKYYRKGKQLQEAIQQDR